MSNEIEHGGYAFQQARVTVLAEDGTPNESAAVTHNGMTLRQFAAIKLRVPNSGTDWLDEMIRESQRDDLAGKAMQAMVSAKDFRPYGWAKGAYEMVDAMLKDREAA